MGAPNTNGILSAIQGKVQGIFSPSIMPASSIIVGSFPDPTAVAPCCEIYAGDDETKHYTLGSGPVAGGKIDDAQYFYLTVTIPSNDRQAAEVLLATIRDDLTAMLHASNALGGVAGVQLARLVGKGKRGAINRAGQQWRVYQQVLYVRFEYAVQVVP